MSALPPAFRWTGCQLWVGRRRTTVRPQRPEAVIEFYLAGLFAASPISDSATTCRSSAAASRRSQHGGTTFGRSTKSACHGLHQAHGASSLTSAGQIPRPNDSPTLPCSVDRLFAAITCRSPAAASRQAKTRTARQVARQGPVSQFVLFAASRLQNSPTIRILNEAHELRRPLVCPLCALPCHLRAVAILQVPLCGGRHSPSDGQLEQHGPVHCARACSRSWRRTR